MTIILVFTIMSTLMIESRTNRENNVQRSLKKAADNAITSVIENQSYSINSNEQFVAAVAQMICDSLISNDGTTSDSTTPDENLKIVIEVVEADYVKGLISLNIIEEYTNPIGSIGTCEYATTVVFDEAKIHDTYTINYYNANGALISSYIVREGDTFPEPSDGIKSKYHITGWGSVIGGGGSAFTKPATVPESGTMDSSTSLFKQTYSAWWSDDINGVKLYGNFVP